MAFFNQLLKTIKKLPDMVMKPDSEDLKIPQLKKKPSQKQIKQEFFLDADASTSLGDLNYMREAKTIRRTFPGTADNPGTKERIIEVAAESEKLEKSSVSNYTKNLDNTNINLNTGVPKPVKKTFAKQISSTEMSKRMKGSAISGVNVQSTSEFLPLGRKEELKPESPNISGKSNVQDKSDKPGSIDPFRQMVKDLNK